MKDIGADWTALTGVLVTRVALGVTGVGLAAIVYALWFLQS
jgi:hypothetical protein